MEETHWARYGGQDMELPCLLQACHPPSTSMHSPTWKLAEPHCSRAFTELNLQCPPPLPGGQWVGWKVSSSSGYLEVPLLALLAYLRCDGKGLIMNKRHSYHSGNSKGFRRSVPGTRDKDQICFCILLYDLSTQQQI